MDAPAMFTHKHVPEDIGHRNTGEVEEEGAGGQAQLHRDEKPHKPVLKKVKEKVKKIKNTLAGGHGNGNGHGGGDERMGEADDAGSGSSEEAEEDAAEREAAMEKGGYMEDVEDKPVVTESDPEVHGAPMYESERAPAVQDLVAKYDQPARTPAVQEAGGDAAAPRVRLGDIGGDVVEDPAAPRSTTPAAREGEDIGTTPVVQQFETMSLSDDPAHVGAGKQGAQAEEWKDKAADTAGGASYTDRLKNAAAGTTDYGKKLASTVYEKVAGVGGTAVGAGKREGERTEAAPASDAAGTKELRDAPEATEGTRGAGYTDKIKSAATGTTGYGKQLASTVYDKVAGVGTAVGVGKRDGERTETVPASDTAGERTEEVPASNTVGERTEAVPASNTAGERTEAVLPSNTAGTEEWRDAPEATTDATRGAGYTDKIKSAAAGTTGYGKQLASTVYNKVAGVGTAVAPNLRPQEGSAKAEGAHSEATPGSDTGAEEWKDAPAADTDATKVAPADTDVTKDAPAGTDAANTSATGPAPAGYTDKIKSAAAGTTQYGKQLASTVYEKVAGVGTAVTGKVQQATKSAGTATPGVGAQQDTPVAGGQDKGVGITGYIAEKLRPGDEHRELSSAISGAVQQRKENVGGTVGQRVPAPGQVVTKAREAVTSLTGGNRVSETVPPATATGQDVKEGYAAEAPVIRGEEVGGAKLNTNTM